MKVRVTMKSPDSVDYAMEDVDNRLHLLGLSGDEFDEEFEHVQNTVREWFKYGEYLTVEIDTETGEATVIHP